MEKLFGFSEFDEPDLQDERESPHCRVIRYLKMHFDDFTFNPDKDPRFFLYLFEDFPELDIEDELKQFHAWTLDQDDWKTIYFRCRFRTWLKRSRKFRARRGQR